MTLTTMKGFSDDDILALGLPIPDGYASDGEPVYSMATIAKLRGITIEEAKKFTSGYPEHIRNKVTKRVSTYQQDIRH